MVGWRNTAAIIIVYYVMTDLLRSAAKMQSSEAAYHIAYLEYLDCMEAGTPDCAPESARLSESYHIFSKDISTASAAVQNKNIRNNRDSDSDSVYIKINDEISLGNRYRPKVRAHLTDYMTLLWITFTLVLCLLIAMM